MSNTSIDSDKHTLVDFFNSDDKDLFAKTEPFGAFIEDMQRKGTYTYRRLLDSACSNRAMVRERSTGHVRQMLMMGSNNYLGLNTRPEIVEAACAAMRRYGASMCGAPLLNGSFSLLLDLEQELAEFVKCEDAMVFPTGYSANVGAISGVLRPKDLVIMDHANHASIVDGCRLAGCTVRSFRHNNMKSLASLLKETKDKFNGRLIVVDGVFSMDGDVAPLPEIVDLARKHHAKVMVDEAHGLGVLGKTGAGTVEHFGLQGKVDLIMGTFSKSLVATGGFVAASHNVINYLRHYARSYFFSASPTPATVGTALAALKILRSEPALRDRLWSNIRHLHASLKSLGLRIYPDPPQSAVVTVIVGDSKTLRAMSRHLDQRGIYLNSVEYPAVPRDQSCLRIGVSAGYTKEDMDTAIAELRIAANTFAHPDETGWRAAM